MLGGVFVGVGRGPFSLLKSNEDTKQCFERAGSRPGSARSALDFPCSFRQLSLVDALKLLSKGLKEQILT
jgi:hypothetical protein